MQHGLQNALSHLPHLICLRICFLIFFRPLSRNFSRATEEEWRARLRARVSEVRKFKAVRVRAIRALQPVALHALPALRILAMGDESTLGSEGESPVVDELDAGTKEESDDILDDMKRFSLKDQPERLKMRWWRVQGTGDERELVEIWDGKGELAREVIERPDFDTERDLDCECIRSAMSWMNI